MARTGRLAALLICFLAPSGAVYADDAVECVQLMLSSFDVDPGPIDGFYGNRTRVASLAFARLTGTAWEPLSAANAATCCAALSTCRPGAMHVRSILARSGPTGPIARFVRRE